MDQRIEQLQETITQTGMEAMIITNPANIFYLTGISNFDSERGFLMAVTADRWKVITSRFYQSRVDAILKPGNVIYVEKGKSMSQTAADFLTGYNRIGFEENNISYTQFQIFKTNIKRSKLIPCRNIIDQMRRIKDGEELDLIRKAARITDKTFARVLKLIKPGITELAIKRKIIEIMQDMGAQGGSFDPIVASGKNAADPHYEGSNKKIKNGEMVIIDIGARYKNYDADMTRTVFIGKATEKYKKIYQIVAGIQEAAINDCRPGMLINKSFKNCIARFKECDMDDNFTHGLGHGVGIEIHEEPSLSPGGQGKFENGMVFTIEPGLYFPGWGGIRIEDLCEINNGKLIILSRTKKQLLEI